MKPIRERDLCPKCGKMMCEKFDEKPGPRGITLAIPNGQYNCYHCGYDSETKP